MPLFNTNIFISFLKTNLFIGDSKILQLINSFSFCCGSLSLVSFSYKK